VILQLSLIFVFNIDLSALDRSGQECSSCVDKDDEQVDGHSVQTVLRLLQQSPVSVAFLFPSTARGSPVYRSHTKQEMHRTNAEHGGE
jgi:hypothetical protein